MDNCGYLSCWTWGCTCDLITRQDKIEHVLFKAVEDVKKGFTKIDSDLTWYRIELKEEIEKMSDKEIDEMYEAFN